MKDILFNKNNLLGAITAEYVLGAVLVGTFGTPEGHLLFLAIASPLVAAALISPYFVKLLERKQKRA